MKTLIDKTFQKGGRIIVKYSITDTRAKLEMHKLSNTPFHPTHDAQSAYYVDTINKEKRQKVKNFIRTINRNVTILKRDNANDAFDKILDKWLIKSNNPLML